MAAVSLLSRVLGRKIKKFCEILLLKIYFGASWGRLLLPLTLPGYAYDI